MATSEVIIQCTRGGICQKPNFSYHWGFENILNFFLINRGYKVLRTVFQVPELFFWEGPMLIQDKLRGSYLVCWHLIVQGSLILMGCGGNVADVHESATWLTTPKLHKRCWRNNKLQNLALIRKAWLPWKLIRIWKWKIEEEQGFLYFIFDCKRLY